MWHFFVPGKGLGLGLSLSGGRPLGLDRRVVVEGAADYFCRKNAGFRKMDPLRIEVWRHRSCRKNAAILHVTVKNTWFLQFSKNARIILEI